MKLTHGTIEAGIVEISVDGIWYGLCGNSFTKENAKVVCVELGFKYGQILPVGAYGKYFNNKERAGISCQGNETSIFDCPYNEKESCPISSFSYVAVSCSKTPPANASGELVT